MKISKKQLSKIVREAVGDEYGLELLYPDRDAYWLDYLHGAYSDMFKSLHGIRPRWAKFDTIEQAEAALDRLQDEIDIELEADDSQKIRDDFEEEISSLRPGPYDIEKAKMSGMGRRQMESRVRSIVRKTLVKTK